jgi:purine-binding chemotaxis protein CheW
MATLEAASPVHRDRTLGAALDGAESPSGGPLEAREFLTFRLGNLEYGIDVRTVLEIRGFESTHRVAHAARRARGAIRFRGAVVPLIDLRTPSADAEPGNRFTTILVLNIGATLLGVVVDCVSRIVTLDARQMYPMHGLGAQALSEGIFALGVRGEQLLILVDLERLIDGRGVALADAARAQ